MLWITGDLERISSIDLYISFVVILMIFQLLDGLQNPKQYLKGYFPAKTSRPEGIIRSAVFGALRFRSLYLI